MRIGIIGAGKMAQALARGLICSGRHKCEELMASCPKVDMKLLDQCKQLGLNTTHDNTEIARENDVIFVAVKPQHVSKVCSEIASTFQREQLLISIALGITIRYIEQLLPAKSRVVRVMPNTPVVVGAGASAYSMGSACQDGDSNTVQNLLSTVGFAVEVPEVHLDPVTGLSGSGPSYVCSMVEAMADGGVKLGLPRDLAIQLAAHSFYGAAKMILETGEHPAVLKEAVQSPGGSTIFGMHELEKGGMRGLLINAVEAASNRSRNTGKSLLPRQSASDGDEEEEREEDVGEESVGKNNNANVLQHKLGHQHYASSSLLHKPIKHNTNSSKNNPYPGLISRRYPSSFQAFD